MRSYILIIKKNISIMIELSFHHILCSYFKPLSVAKKSRDAQYGIRH